MRYFGHELPLQQFLNVRGVPLAIPWSKWVESIALNVTTGMLDVKLRNGRRRAIFLSLDPDEAREEASAIATAENIDQELNIYLHWEQTEERSERLFPDKDWVSVTSSNVESFRHDAERNALEVSYKGGRVYEYPDMSLEYVEDLFTASSKGKWSWAHLRGRSTVRVAGRGALGGKYRPDPYKAQRKAAELAQRKEQRALRRKWKT